jgi:ectoine hydroxylase-related dioxygenase (phytanoyl-CoA dioxygenase family)
MSEQQIDTASMEKHFDELDTRGCTVLKDMLSPRQIEQAIEALRQSYQEEHVSAHEPGTLRTHNLTARAEVFQEIIQVPRLVACMGYLLGEDYTLSDMGARSPAPGMTPQGLHRDGGKPMPNPPFNTHAAVPQAAQSMIALSEFTVENGGTRFVPGSHVRNIEADAVPPADEQLFLCAPGTVLIFDNRLLHGGGANTTDEVRYSIQGFCCRRTTRPFCDHTRSIPPDVVVKATPLMRRLWGFSCQTMWEESPRNFKLLEAQDAAPHFDYLRGIETGG